MGCQREDYDRRGSNRGRGCVKDTVRRILDAQREASRDHGHGCSTSCERSIEDLLSPSRDRRPSRYTTIPFMLVCKDSCSTFFGSGFCGRGDGRGRRGHFECVESPVFKVRGFARGSDSCVQLELLMPVHHHHHGKGDGEGHFDGVEDSYHHGGCKGKVCDYFGNHRIENFRHTGVCITVDLDCFCGISCLDPITPLH